MDAGPTLPPPGWYPVPGADAEVRYWDGAAWTEHLLATTDVEPAPDAAPVVAAVAAPFPAPDHDDDRDLAANVPGAAWRAKVDALPHTAVGSRLAGHLRRVPTDAQAFRLRARGEEEVARRLRRLGDDWRVLHAIACDGRDDGVDHLVVGPGGVFAITTRNHEASKVVVAGSTVTVNGTPVDHLGRARHAAQLASRFLGAACGTTVTVEPVLVVLGRQISVPAEPEDVRVFDPWQVGRWLERRPAVLDAATVDAIHAHARRARTWRDE